MSSHISQFFLNSTHLYLIFLSVPGLAKLRSSGSYRTDFGVHPAHARPSARTKSGTRRPAGTCRPLLRWNRPHRNILSGLPNIFGFRRNFSIGRDVSKPGARLDFRARRRHAAPEAPVDGGGLPPVRDGARHHRPLVGRLGQVLGCVKLEIINSIPKCQPIEQALGRFKQSHSV